LTQPFSLEVPPQPQREKAIVNHVKVSFFCYEVLFLDSYSFTYSELLYQLPEKQKELMIAICKEGKATARVKDCNINILLRHPEMMLYKLHVFLFIDCR